VTTAIPAPKPSVKPVNRSELERLVAGTHHDPHGVLGPHPHAGAVTVRTLRPLASSVIVEMSDGSRTELRHELEGTWVGVLPTAEVEDYRILVAYDDGIEHLVPRGLLLGGQTTVLAVGAIANLLALLIDREGQNASGITWFDECYRHESNLSPSTDTF